MSIFEKTKKFVKEKLQNIESGHDWFHIERVYNNTILIAENEICDKKVVKLAALLHDIANWKIPNKMVKGMGGAMNLVASAENIIVAMMHVNKAGDSKILKKYSLPLTGFACVKKVVTELAVLEVTPLGFKLLELAPTVSVEHIIASTEANLIIDGEIPEMQF